MKENRDGLLEQFEIYKEDISNLENKNFVLNEKLTILLSNLPDEYIQTAFKRFELLERIFSNGKI